MTVALPVVSVLPARLHERLADPHGVLQRQAAILVVVLLSLFMFLRSDINAGSAGLVLLAVAMVVGATLLPLLLPAHGRPRAALVAIPLVDLFAVGILRYTTGGSTSLYGALLILPVISLGIERGILPVVLAAVSCAAIIGVPIAVSGVHDDWLRIISTPLVMTLAALTVNRLASRLRERARAENWLRREQEVLVYEAEQHAAATVAVAAQLRRSSLLMSGVVDAVTQQFIIATDAVGRIEVFNPGGERLLGEPASAAVGHGLIEVFGDRFVRHHRPGDPWPHAPELLSDLGFDSLVASAAGGTGPVAWTYQPPDRGAVILEISTTVRRDGAGGVDGFLFVGTDVTEGYEQAKLKDEFVSLISHELRTPLSSILGYLELLADDEDAPLADGQRQYLDIIDRNAHRLLRLVGDLLFTAHVEAGKLSLEPRPLDLSTIAAAAVESAEPAASAAGISLQLVACDHPVLVSGDAMRMGQVCDNLLSNAIKFTGRGGVVTVSLEADQDAGRARLAVADTGMGIPAADLDKLFGRFFRASTATANAVPGVGLGLSISKAIAQAHGGSIGVTSTVGVGTTFTFEVPLDGSAPTPADLSSVGSAGPVAANPAR